MARALMLEVLELRDRLASLRRELTRLKGDVEALKRELRGQKRLIDELAGRW